MSIDAPMDETSRRRLAAVAAMAVTIALGLASVAGAAPDRRLVGPTFE